MSTRTLSERTVSAGQWRMAAWGIQAVLQLAVGVLLARLLPPAEFGLAGLAMVLNADGFGSRPVKVSKYRAFTRAAPTFHEGFKLFYEEDAGLMTPREVLGLRPAPDVVVYE